IYYLILYTNGGGWQGGFAKKRSFRRTGAKKGAFPARVLCGVTKKAPAPAATTAILTLAKRGGLWHNKNMRGAVLGPPGVAHCLRRENYAERDLYPDRVSRQTDPQDRVQR